MMYATLILGLVALGTFIFGLKVLYDKRKMFREDLYDGGMLLLFIVMMAIVGAVIALRAREYGWL